LDTPSYIMSCNRLSIDQGYVLGLIRVDKLQKNVYQKVNRYEDVGSFKAADGDCLESVNSYESRDSSVGIALRTGKSGF
jgi:hypothetical protein